MLKRSGYLFRVKGHFIACTAREVDCAFGVLLCRSYEHIACDLNISRRTVESHVSKLYDKFDCRTKKEFLAMVDGELFAQFNQAFAQVPAAYPATNSAICETF